MTKSILIHWLGFGVVMASVGRLIANQHLMTTATSSSHVKQNVEWLYAFDVHCNAFVPLFVLLCECIWKAGGMLSKPVHTRANLAMHHLVSDGVQFFLLPIVLGTSLLSLGVSNTLFAVAFGWYFYITHLGYRGENFVVCCDRLIVCSQLLT